MAAAVVSGLAAMLACYGLTCSFATDPPDAVFERKWLGGHLAVSFLLLAVWLGVCAGAFLV